jgi:hypothetical protein
VNESTEKPNQAQAKAEIIRRFSLIVRCVFANILTANENLSAQQRNGEPLRFVFYGLRPSADWDWVTQASRKGHPSITQA